MKSFIVFALICSIWFGGSAYLYASLNIVNEDPEFCQTPTYMMLATWPIWMVDTLYTDQLEHRLMVAGYKMCNE